MHHWPGLLLRKERKIIHKPPPSPPCAREKGSNLEKKKKKSKKFKYLPRDKQRTLVGTASAGTVNWNDRMRTAWL